MITKKAGKQIILGLGCFLCSSLYMVNKRGFIGRASRRKLEQERGEDAYGNRYNSMQDMWQRELNPLQVASEDAKN